MANIRLNKEMRKELEAYAETLLSFPEEEAKVEELYKLAQGAARAAVARHCPESDLLVLAKYSHARQRDDFAFAHNSFNYTQFEFKKETGPLSRNSYNALPCELDEYEKIDDFNQAKKALKKHRDELLRDYHNLIAACRTFEELVEVWPEAEVMRDSVEGRAGRRAISCLSSEAIERIKADVAKRAS